MYKLYTLFQFSSIFVYIHWWRHSGGQAHATTRHCHWLQVFCSWV